MLSGKLRSAVWAAGLAASLAACVDPPTEHRVRANAYLRAGEAQKALEEIDRGIVGRPADVSLHIMRGKALFELERYDDARAAYESALAHGKSEEPRSLSEAHLGLAAVATRKGDWQAARAQFETLVKVDDRDADAQLNLARVCLQQKELDCAVAHAEVAGRLRGDAEDVLFTLGRIYVAAKRLDDAEKTFVRIGEVVPSAASSPYGRAIVAAQRGDVEVALTRLGEALGKKLPNPDKLADDPLLAPLKDDPRFAALVAKAR